MHELRAQDADRRAWFRLRGLILVVLAVFGTPQFPGAQSSDWIEAYREPATRLITEALSSRFAWERLALLSDTFGHRLSGSKALEDAIQWAVQEMKKDELDDVRAEPVKVPHWVRGQESAEIVSPRRAPLAMLGLGNSIGTPSEGIEGEVIVVRSFSELDSSADRVRGKIVLYNVPFTTYGDTVQVPIQRTLSRGCARRACRPGSSGRAARASHTTHRCAALRR